MLLTVDPYITWDSLCYHFNSGARAVIDEFLYSKGPRFVFRSHLNTEKKLDQYLKTREEHNGLNNDHLKRVLVEFMQNRILLIDSKNFNCYFPRIKMNTCYSFQCLSHFEQQKLQELYINYYYKRQENLWYNIGMERLPVYIYTHTNFRLLEIVVICLFVVKI